MQPPSLNGRASGEDAFSRCLDRAVERDTAPRAAPGEPGARPDGARARGDDTGSDTGQAAPEDGATAHEDAAGPARDAAHGTRARGARRPGTAEARGDAAGPAKDPAPIATKALPEGGPAAEAIAPADVTHPADAAEPRSIDSLLPGWPCLPREQTAAAPAVATPSGAVASFATEEAGGTSEAPVMTEPAGAAAGRIGADPALRASSQAGAQHADATQASRLATAGTADTLRDPAAAARPRFEDALQTAAEASAARAPAGAIRATPDLAAPPAWAVAPAGSTPAVATVAEPTRVAQMQVAAPVDSPAFAPALATQVRWLVREGMQEARLSLNPAEMGPVTVQIVIDGRDARIDFRADVAATRQALEASLPVLAAALDDSGLRLSGGGVHDGASARHGQPGAGTPTPGRGLLQGADIAPAGPPASTRRDGRERGLVDLVA